MVKTIETSIFTLKCQNLFPRVGFQACNHFRLYNGKAAEQELRTLQDQTSSSFNFGKDLIEHNLVVFRNGEGALQV